MKQSYIAEEHFSLAAFADIDYSLEAFAIAEDYSLEEVRPSDILRPIG